MRNTAQLLAALALPVALVLLSLGHVDAAMRAKVHLQVRNGDAQPAGGDSAADRHRLFRWRPHTFTHYSDEPRDRDRLGGTLPTWLSEAAAAGRELEALRDVRMMAQTLVMGHGTSVLAREYGGAVGRFRHVVRFNRFEVEGYERWVGNKTTSWLINQLDIKLGSKLPGMRLLRGMEEARVLALSRKSAHSIKAITRKLPSSVGIKLFDLREQQLWKANFNFTAKFFSTGVVALIQLLPRAPIAVHGFDFAKGSNGHYFARVSKETCHDVAAEGFLFQQLQRDGVLVPLACLESAGLDELYRECAVTRIVPPANRYTLGCKKNAAGQRTDLGAKVHQSGEVAIYGRAGLPKPLVI
mmetsp:Transcript_19062/g.47986  ORF Transcript_19062/g.47986 Transcript_19062/m.47986 type:complete len:355 (-) Transcript_19062:257-1321(-)